MKIAILALALAIATASPIKELFGDIPESLDGSLHLVEGQSESCFGAGPFNLCCGFDGAWMRYGWNVSDLILADATYNVTWNPFAVMLTGGHCRFDIAQLFGVYFSTSCNVGYTQVPLTVLFNGNMNENSFLSYLSVDAGYCNLNATSAWYECIWQENVIGGPACGFTPPQNLTNGTYSFGYQYIQPIWPSQAVSEECPDPK